MGQRTAYNNIMSALLWREAQFRLTTDSLESWEGEDTGGSLDFSGNCPRCKHDFRRAVEPDTDIVVADAGLAPDAAGTTSQEVLYNAATMFRCACAVQHPKRPATKTTGCGAYWVARPTAVTHRSYTLEAVTDENLIADATLVAVEAEAAGAGMRTLAEKWIPGIAAILGILGLAGVVVSADAAQGLSLEIRKAIFALVALAVLGGVVATALVYRAAFGWPKNVPLQTDEQVIAAAKEIRDRNTRAGSHIRTAVAWSVGSIVALLVALGLAWLQPESVKHMNVTYTEGDSTASVCGKVGDVKDGKLALEVTDGNRTTTEHVELGSVTKLEPSTGCG